MSYLYQGLAGSRFTTECSPRTQEEREAVIRKNIEWETGYVMGTAQSLGYPLRWGGDWDADTETNDNRFDDLVHFELAD